MSKRGKRASRLFLVALICYAIGFVPLVHSRQLTEHWLMHGTGGAANDWAWAGVIFTVLALISLILPIRDNRRAKRKVSK